MAKRKATKKKAKKTTKKKAKKATKKKAKKATKKKAKKATKKKAKKATKKKVKKATKKKAKKTTKKKAKKATKKKAKKATSAKVRVNKITTKPKKSAKPIVPSLEEITQDSSDAFIPTTNPFAPSEPANVEDAEEVITSAIELEEELDLIEEDTPYESIDEIESDDFDSLEDEDGGYF